MRRAAAAALVLAGAAVFYAVAAWSVRPGFYDGFAPPAPYNFVNPPAQVKATNKPPLAGSATVKVINNVVQPASAFTQDAQAQLSWVPGAFDPPSDGGSLVVGIKPVTSPPPNPSSFTLVSNVYQFTANSKLAKEANLALTFSDQLPTPSSLYHADDAGHWTAVVSNQSSSVFVISARVTQLGYYAAGYDNVAAAGSSARVGGGSQWLPIAVALLILVVILAGIPLAVVRRRSGGGGSPPGGGDEPPATPPSRRPQNRSGRRRT